MKYEDYEAKLKSVITTPDKAPDVVLELLSEIKNDTDLLTSMQATIKENETKIKSLQDDKVSLFMRLTGEDSNDDGPKDWTELEGDEAIDAFIEAHKEV